MFITFEGIDGSGKSTQAAMLEERLRQEGHPVLLVREPGGTTLSERIRSLLLDRSLQIQPFSELLLFSAARHQLVEERIRPALAAGVVVVCDRFFDSTTAYQGGARGVAELSWLSDLHLRVTGGLVPDATYLIKLDPEEAHQRMKMRPGSAPDDRIEAQGLEFQRAVARAYDAIAEEEPARVHRFDGRLRPDVLHAQIWQHVCETMPETSTGRSGSSFDPEA
ncbi:MAG TPA: dTMP kinase [Rhodothermales bacterium]